jgi:AMMECR1 domain-containing protein
MMARSVLLQLARDSIQEVLELNQTIDKSKLIKEHPLLQEAAASSVNIYIDDELRGSCETKIPSYSLLDDIIINAKKAAFEDENFTPMTTSEYLHCEIELKLVTPEGVISQRDESIL